MVLPALYYNVYEPVTSRRIRPAVPENKKILRTLSYCPEDIYFVKEQVHHFT